MYKILVFNIQSLTVEFLYNYEIGPCIFQKVILNEWDL